MKTFSRAPRNLTGPQHCTPEPNGEGGPVDSHWSPQAQHMPPCSLSGSHIETTCHMSNIASPHPLARTYPGKKTVLFIFAAPV